MSSDEMRAILSQQLASFRAWTYAQLAERVEQDRTAHECLDSSEGVASDGSAYFIELNAYWDDEPRGDVRVCGCLSVAKQKPLFGFVHVYGSNASQCFIMNPDGQLIGEDESFPGRYLPPEFTTAVLLAYYLVPMFLCIGLSLLVDGWTKWVLVACAFLWPAANVALGVIQGCD